MQSIIKMTKPYEKPEPISSPLKVKKTRGRPLNEVMDAEEIIEIPDISKRHG
jgi:hypothetical protein